MFTRESIRYQVSGVKTLGLLPERAERVEGCNPKSIDNLAITD
jgi:hypothetical protein